MIIHGDSLEVLKTLPENSVDAIVTDPPYGLSFMGKKWDYNVPSTDLWVEVYRVLKPGGHLLSFGGTRTYHRLAIGIEHAGFEIRDQIQWIYGSGFPKSLDVSKAIDKAAGAEREVVGSKIGQPGYSLADNGRTNEVYGDYHDPKAECAITAPATPDAIKWQGFGTALKPANEPIVLARKPLSESTVAKNVIKHGTGALNIDGTRIANQNGEIPKGSGNANKNSIFSQVANSEGNGGNASTQGRWPANVLFDEEAAAMLDEQSGTLKSGAGNKHGKHENEIYKTGLKANYIGPSVGGDSGGASRFFYCAKASRAERNRGMADQVNGHPTVKPQKLLEYLIKLIAPPGGTVLDCFCGSGSTGVAAINLGFTFIGIEREIDYVKIAEKRIEHASAKDQLDLEGA